MKIHAGKTYIVTGGTGFLGVKLIERIIASGGLVRTVARNEGNLIKLKETFGDALEIHPGDIANEFVINQLFAEEFEGVFHLAAFKHVPLAEKNTMECVFSNVIGSMNILEYATMYNPSFIIAISTDKAAQVSGTYGATKFLMEKMFQQYATIYPEIAFRVVRYGNVLYSTGSVLCKWKSLLEQGKELVVTSREATRFFWSIDQALDLVFDCLENAKNAQPYVPTMKAMRIGDLLLAIEYKYSKNGRIANVREIGLQDGENLHEKMTANGLSSNEVELYTVEEIMKLI